MLRSQVKFEHNEKSWFKTEILYDMLIWKKKRVFSLSYKIRVISSTWKGMKANLLLFAYLCMWIAHVQKLVDWKLKSAHQAH